VNLSLANTRWYVLQLLRRDRTFPVSSPPLDDSAHPLKQTARDSSFVMPDGTTLHPRPRYGDDYLVADAVLLDVVRTNAWRDPVCFSATAGPDGAGWLQPYARRRGLHSCLGPVPNAGPERDVLRANLLTRQTYRGYADPSVTLEPFSRQIGALYLDSLGALLDAERAAGDTARCRDDMRRVLAAVPPDRAGLTARDRAALEARCGPSA